MEKNMDPLKIEAEIAKMMAENSKLMAEASKLMAETTRINKESHWYPLVVASGIIATVATIVKVFF